MDRSANRREARSRILRAKNGGLELSDPPWTRSACTLHHALPIHRLQNGADHLEQCSEEQQLQTATLNLKNGAVTFNQLAHQVPGFS